MREHHRCRKRRLVFEQGASSLSVVGCYAFTQNPERFDAARKRRAIEAKHKQGMRRPRSALKIDSRSNQKSTLGRDAAPNRASELKREPCFIWSVLIGARRAGHDSCVAVRQCRQPFDKKLIDKSLCLWLIRLRCGLMVRSLPLMSLTRVVRFAAAQVECSGKPSGVVRPQANGNRVDNVTCALA